MVIHWITKFAAILARFPGRADMARSVVSTPRSWAISELTVMKPNQPLHLTGELRIGCRFLELHTGRGAKWELSTTRLAHRHIGRRVEVIGLRAGFNDLLCHEIWPAGGPRPTPRYIRVVSRIEL